MKKIIAIIRPNKYFQTREALVKNGFPALTSMMALGRGKNRDNTFLLADSDYEDEVTLYNEQLVSKKMLEIVVRDEDKDKIIKIIMEENATGTHGDGKIFVIPVEEVERIRTGEKSNDAIV